tara:strand:- start:141 stop:2789 length:2649 start_codon:yes stop_codon:yes gene_type:complete
MKHYWGSNAINSVIRHLPNAATFAELAHNYYENGVAIPYTRKEYNDLDEELKSEVKKIAYITACSFKEGTTSRSNSNAEALQLVILDVDNPHEAQALIDLKDAIRDQMGDLNFLIHTTISHTDESPRLRVVVSVEECGLENRKPMTRHIANLLGLTNNTYDDDGLLIGVEDGFDSCSTVTSQAFFRPVVFQGDTEGTIVVSRTTGSDLTVEDTPEDVFVEELQDFSYTGEHEWDDDLESLPLQNLEMDWVESALQNLDPDEADDSGNTYIPWFQICCALRHQFRNEEDAAVAFNIFNDWSARSSSRYGGKETTYRKWRSFVPCPTGRRPTTIRTLFKRAIKSGWDYKEMAEKVQLTFEEWLDKTDSPTVLAKEGLERIAAMPFKDDNEIIQNDLIAKMDKRLKKLGVSGTTLATLKKQLRKEKIKSAPVESSDDKPKWLQPWCYIAPDNLLFNTHSKVCLTPAAFNNVYDKEMLKDEPVEARSPTGRPMMAAKDFAMNIKEIKTVFGVMYDPSYAGDNTYLKYEGKLFVNTYRPPTVKGDPSLAKEAEAIFRSHLSTMIGDTFQENYIIKMMAFCAQYPERKIRILPLIHSVAGTGKTLMGEMFQNVIGSHNTMVMSADKLKGTFTSYFSSCQACFLEEVRMTGQSRFETMDKLKEVITNEVILVEEKFKNPTKIVNRIFLMGFTNAEDAIALEAADRRFFCVKYRVTHEEVREMHEVGYFANLARLAREDTAQLEGKTSLVGGFVHWMRTLDCTDFDPDARAPLTDYREELVESSENPLKTEIKDFISDEEETLVGEDIICQSYLTSNCREKFHSKSFSVYLRELGYYPHKVGKTRNFRISGVRTAVWVNPRNLPKEEGDPIQILKDRMDADKTHSFDELN